MIDFLNVRSRKGKKHMYVCMVSEENGFSSYKGKTVILTDDQCKELSEFVNKILNYDREKAS